MHFCASSFEAWTGKKPFVKGNHEKEGNKRDRGARNIAYRDECVHVQALVEETNQFDNAHLYQK